MIIVIGEPKFINIASIKTKGQILILEDDVNMVEALFKIVAPPIIEPIEIKECFKEKRPKKNWEPKFYHQRDK